MSLNVLDISSDDSLLLSNIYSGFLDKRMRVVESLMMSALLVYL